MPDLQAIRQIAEGILARNPDPVVRIRLLRDVLQKPPANDEVIQARKELATSRWVEGLEREQWDDGSWGRLHSRDSSAKQKIPTTEAGVERALALGLDVPHPVLAKASRYLIGILEGRTECRDRPEKNDRWPTGVQLFSAATLAQIQPDLSALDDAWHLWVNIARRTFASGAYDPEAEVRAHHELTGASVKNSYLVLDNRYSLALLGARAEALPADLETALVSWVWHCKDGIRYLRVKLPLPPRHLKTGSLDRWFTSLELLSRFSSWRALAKDAIQWLWEERAPGSLWDFGQKSTFSVFLPLSESWRKTTARQFDWTTRVLVLLRRYHSPGSPRP